MKSKYISENIINEVKNAKKEWLSQMQIVYYIKEKYNLKDFTRRNVRDILDDIIYKRIENTTPKKILNMDNEEEIVREYKKEWKIFKYNISSNNDVYDITINTSEQNHINDVEKLFEKVKLNIKEYNIKTIKFNYWESFFRNWNEIEIVPLYQIKITFVPKKNVNLIERYRNELDFYYKNANDFKKIKEKKEKKEKNMIEICPKDIHFNKRGHKELLWEEYNTSIAERRFSTIIDKTIEIAKKITNNNIDSINLILWSDMFNIDNNQNATSNWTPQDICEEYELGVQKTIKFLINEIENLYKNTKAKIHIIMVPWNHDYGTTFHIWNVLKYFFMNKNKKITVDNSLFLRKYIVYWKQCIAITHWNWIPRNNFFNVILKEMNSKKIKADNVEIHTWHLHKQMQENFVWIDEFWLRFRIVSSISGTDNWHNLKWYIWNKKAIDSFIWNKDRWLICELNIWE